MQVVDFGKFFHFLAENLYINQVVSWRSLVNFFSSKKQEKSVCYNQVKLWALQSFFFRYLFVLAFFSPQFEIRILISRFFEESGEFYH